MEFREIRSNNELSCLHCGVKITIENYSGWEAFTEDGKTTQPICKFCDLVLDCINEKEEIRNGQKRSANI